MLKLSGLGVALTGVVLGTILLVLGVALAFGLAYCLMLTGVLFVGGSLLIVDVSPDGRKENRK